MTFYTEAKPGDLFRGSALLYTHFRRTRNQGGHRKGNEAGPFHNESGLFVQLFVYSHISQLIFANYQRMLSYAPLIFIIRKNEVLAKD